VGYFDTPEKAATAIAIAEHLFDRDGTTDGMLKKVQKALVEQGVVPPKKAKSPRPARKKKAKGAAGVPRRRRSSGTSGYKGESLVPGLPCSAVLP
jgi:hypothetical protein